MRSTPASLPGIARASVEYRVRFHAPLRSAEAASPAARTESSPEPPPKPEPPPPAPPPAAPTPTQFWSVESENELQLDRERIETVLAEIRAAVATLRQERESRLRDWQRAAIELAMTTAARLLHERIESGDFPIDAKVRDMIAQLGEDIPVVVRLNPLDLELLKSRLGRTGGESLLTEPDAPRFVADSALNRGECHVEGRDSMLVSDVSRELQEIRDELLRSLKNAGS